MSVTRIATRYAKSLIELAQEQGKLEAVHNDIGLLSAAMTHRELRTMFKSPVVTADKKIGVVDGLFNDKIDALTVQYLHLLIKKGREGYFPEIAAEFEEQYKKIKHITSVRISSAVPLSDSVMKTLEAKIKASGLTEENLEVETVIDPNLLGGFVIEFGDKRYDASISEKLADLGALFSKNLYIKEF